MVGGLRSTVAAKERDQRLARARKGSMSLAIRPRLRTYQLALRANSLPLQHHVAEAETSRTRSRRLGRSCGEASGREG